jgi:hypothetical protein
MNVKDEIVEDVRAAREAYAARFNYDLADMYKYLKAKEQASNHPIAKLEPVQPQPNTVVSN